MEFLALTNIGLSKSQMKSIAPVNEVVRGQPIKINHSDSNPEFYTYIKVKYESMSLLTNNLAL